MEKVNGAIRFVTKEQYDKLVVNIKTHEEQIICPQCNAEQAATVEHTLPWATYIHHCKYCKYLIMESEWNKVN